MYSGLGYAIFSNRPLEQRLTPPLHCSYGPLVLSFHAAGRASLAPVCSSKAAPLSLCGAAGCNANIWPGTSHPCYGRPEALFPPGRLRARSETVWIPKSDHTKLQEGSIMAIGPLSRFMTEATEFWQVCHLSAMVLSRCRPRPTLAVRAISPGNSDW